MNPIENVTIADKVKVILDPNRSKDSPNNQIIINPPNTPLWRTLAADKTLALLEDGINEFLYFSLRSKENRPFSEKIVILDTIRNHWSKNASINKDMYWIAIIKIRLFIILIFASILWA